MTNQEKAAVELFRYNHSEKDCAFVEHLVEKIEALEAKVGESAPKEENTSGVSNRNQNLKETLSAEERAAIKTQARLATYERIIHDRNVKLDQLYTDNVALKASLAQVQKIVFQKSETVSALKRIIEQKDAYIKEAQEQIAQLQKEQEENSALISKQARELGVLRRMVKNQSTKVVVVLG